MKRRDFITRTTLATAGATGLLAASCTNAEKKAAATNEHPQSSIPEFPLQEATIASLQEKMAAGTYSSAAITQLYLDRIAAVDHSGPRLNAVIEINPDAVAIARSLDEERKNGKVRGPLHGIPVLIKDNIDTADKMQTTAGALALEGNIARQDAFVVKKLREAGAVILGKTNLSEWANFRSSHSCSGWSSRGGQTKCPYILDHNPCGSSSGSGSAVAANLCVVAVGTETDGSVTCPSSVNALAGIKPTVGLVSRSGIIPISATQDTAGPMARTVTDMAILLSAMTGADPADPITAGSQGKTHADYTLFLKKDALQGKRIGIEKKPQGNDPFLHKLQERAIRKIMELGGQIVEVEYLDAINKLGGAEFTVLQYEFRDGVNRYLAQSTAKVKTLADVIRFNRENEEKAMPFFKQETLESSDTKTDLHAAEYLQALEHSMKGGRKILDEVMDKNQLDAIAGLTMGPACSIDLIYGDRWGDVSLTTPAAITGYPHITVPAGLVYGLPVGFSFFGRPYREDLLIGLGYAYEQATHHRQVPAFQTSFLP